MTVRRGLDHLVIALRDLDAGARFYEALGLQVGALNRHPWGTHNRLVQFDGSFLELITVGEGAAIPDHEPRRFSFGAFVRDFLARSEGLAMVVLDSADAQADAALFAERGLGEYEPFFFSRKGRRPDGGETEVAFTLAFTAPRPGLRQAFFVCQQHYPENFWNPAFQIHPNGASGVSMVTLAEGVPGAGTEFLTAFTGAPPVETQAGAVHRLARGALRVVPADGGETGFTLAVADTASVAERLLRAGIPFTNGAGRIEVRHDAAFGVAITVETR